MKHLTDATIDQFVKKQLPDSERLSVKFHLALCIRASSLVLTAYKQEAFMGADGEGVV